jgi:hypothetical protein
MLGPIEAQLNEGNHGKGSMSIGHKLVITTQQSHKSLLLPQIQKKIGMKQMIFSCSNKPWLVPSNPKLFSQEKFEKCLTNLFVVQDLPFC